MIRRRMLRPLVVSVLLVAALGCTLVAQEKLPLTFEQIYRNAEPRITTPLPSIIGWLDGKTYLVSKKNDGDDHPKIYAVDARSGTETFHHDVTAFKSLLPEGVNPEDYTAADAAYSLFLYMNGGDLYLLDAKRQTFRRLTETPAEEKNPTFSPDYHAVAFTRDGDLYAIDLSTRRETRLTNDGSDVIYNGWASWVYYEEIFGRPSRYRAFWWSPDSKRIAFYRFDDSKVPIYPLYDVDGAHGSVVNTRYPQPADSNPGVRIGIVNAAGGSIVWAGFNDALDQYFGPPFWIPDGTALLVQWMNRGQDSLKVIAVDPSRGSVRTLFTEHQASWVDWYERMTFVPGGMVVRSDRDGWRHLFLYGVDGTLKKKITDGPWAVENVVALDENSGRLLFTARKEASTRTDLYSVRLDGTDLRRLTFGAFTHSVDVAPGGAYFLTTYSNISTPSRLALCDASGKALRELGDSKTEAFNNYRLSLPTLFTVRTPDGYDLPAMWTLPPGLDSTKRYPVLISVYGGPGSQSVSDGWKGIREQWLAQEGMIQMSVDHRGSGHFGKTGEALMYRNLGKWEMNDYIEAVRWLRRQRFVDSTRICITGGSYGGYVTLLALTQGADYFTHGIASASVVDWTLYDSHYTERYMDSPSENPDGYASGSVLTYADKLKGKLLIIHGTMDDNVHMQHVLQLTSRFEDLNKQFDLALYPNGRHGWGGAKAVHQRNLVNRFYYENLLKKDFPAELFKSGGVMSRSRRPRGM